MYETIEHGTPKTGFLKFGDTVKIEMHDATGASIFGSIEQASRRMPVTLAAATERNRCHDGDTYFRSSAAYRVRIALNLKGAALRGSAGAPAAHTAANSWGMITAR